MTERPRDRRARARSLIYGSAGPEQRAEEDVGEEMKSYLPFFPLRTLGTR